MAAQLAEIFGHDFLDSLRSLQEKINRACSSDVIVPTGTIASLIPLKDTVIGSFQRLIEEERKATRKPFVPSTKNQLETLINEGRCITDLSSKYCGRDLLGHYIFHFFHQRRRPLRGHRFTNGSHVIVSGDQADGETRRGTVVASYPHFLRVALWWDLKNLAAPNTMIVSGSPPVVFDQMEDALEFAMNDVSTDLEDNMPAEGIQGWASRYSRLDPAVKVGDPEFRDLNLSQIRSISMACGNSVSLIQGPPGTGKTRVVVETLKLLKVWSLWFFQRQMLTENSTLLSLNVGPFWGEASNTPLLKPVYLASPDPASAGYKHSLENQMKIHSLYGGYYHLHKQEELCRRRVAEMRKLRYSGSLIFKSLSNQEPSSTSPEFASWKERAKALNEQMDALRGKMRRDVLEQADVICTTCFSASKLLPDFNFPIVIIDEASACTEPASLIPIMKGCSHLVLVGDHKQLGPIVNSSEARRGGLGVSLFERLLGLESVPHITLDTQYRMHPALSQFPSSEFYHGLLKDGTIDHNGNGETFSHLSAPISTFSERIGDDYLHSLFLYHRSPATRVNSSWNNDHEATLVLRVVEDLLLRNYNLSGHDIGIISPYKAQISLLEDKFAQQPATKSAVLSPERINELRNVAIRTVDGFQGQEKDVIIYSTTRSHESGLSPLRQNRAISFIADKRRLNVALTRAKRGFVLLGDSDFLSQHHDSPALARYMRSLYEKRCVLKLDDALMDQVLSGNLYC
ncbi:hypothetical protein NLI96_g12310 [Meripilus lineatus]|uniref:Uncharacterized protein n=1 Tax=Meripilus lineatus TaxID=2056292 RepID=A0AAD5URT7_9APHY|nr:hypothetical protein NLI96_g12310 [Physisporinus lineatus]